MPLAPLRAVVAVPALEAAAEAHVALAAAIALVHARVLHGHVAEGPHEALRDA